ncbi:DJ-1/PfpI family protein [Nocardia sp. NPDC049526]|uniref:DJ-1/PfpI family protein n=1 Tax=Nocardia sp. NPDC049526 TaxID=3364316 RepID=UPI0037A7FE75
MGSAERGDTVVAVGWCAAARCGRAFVSAEAVLLDGRRATTHWPACGELAARYSGIDVDADAIYVRDGPIITSAGVTAGIDMALTLVEEDHRAELARASAEHLVSPNSALHDQIRS